MIARCLILTLMVFAGSAGAQEIRVGNDDELRRALANAKAQTVIKLAPGTYRGGISATLRGEKDKPIVIAAADAANPPVIQGGGSGIHLVGSKYVTLRNLKVRGASGNGLNIDDGGKLDQPAVGIVIENIHVEDIGPVGDGDGIKMSGVRDFVLRGCTVEGWGGNAIDLVGCADGVIEGCTVRGKEGFKPATGPQMKGGTSKVIVRKCRFENVGGRAVNAGGSTGLPYFRPPNAAYEAKDLTIEDNVFVGGEAPVAFVGVDGAIFRHNTIIEPGKWVMRILQESRDARFVRCRNVTFERNLIVYKRANVRTAVNIGPDTQPETFTFKENWWWCSDAAKDRPALPSAETGGIYGRDPELKIDPSSRPSVGNLAARAYGAR